MRILFTGGGTGGHIYPALAMAQLIQQRKRDAEIIFVGTDRGLERELVPKAGFKLKKVAAAGLKRRLVKANLGVFAANAYGFFQALKVVHKFKPHVVVGTGGYVTVPVILASVCLRKPIILHEQNVLPGLANKILSQFANCVALSYEQSAAHFKRARRVVITGNPVRPAIWQQSREQGRHNLDIKANARFVLVFGGSRGARPITEAAVAAAERLLLDPRLTLLIVTGRADFVTIEEKVRHLGIQASRAGKMLLRPYMYNMEDALAAADIVVTRAGATTLAEITARGLPAVLIPSPYVTANHQEYNARTLADSGAAVMIKEQDLSPRVLADTIQSLLADPQRLVQMGAAARSLGRRNAAEILVQEILKFT
ncbi:MAG: undecaprenyldiphospho-muramoylpentapeptide beta-N-acetylglucosaminyltransferase [Firmicutes bacterium]|mgnify:CR=1 FL=1|nr:undecaprenyldiphospho-muramoylpentapeptide beta-N-acetylglucosaminyltransferase [Bacillota bacterium]